MSLIAHFDVTFTEDESQIYENGAKNMALFRRGMPKAFSEWNSPFGDNMMTGAAMDRLIHHGDIYQIE